MEPQDQLIDEAQQTDESKAEVDEYLSNLDNPDTKPAIKAAVKKAAPRKSSPEKEVKKPEPKNETKQEKKLPSWLL